MITLLRAKAMDGNHVYLPPSLPFGHEGKY